MSVVSSVRALFAAVLLLALAPSTAGAADPDFEAALSPERIAFGDPDPEGRLTVRTGSEGASFSFTVGGSGPDYVDLDGNDAGGPLLSSLCRNDPRVEGPGTARITSCVARRTTLARCNRTYLPVYRGILSGGTFFEATVPPRSRAVIAVPLAQTSSPPWSTSRYGVAFDLSGGSLDASRTVTGTTTAPAGRTGVPIGLATEPSGVRCGSAPKVRGPITVRGRTEPRLAGQEIVLRTATEAQPEPRELARVRVGDDGTFAYAGWRPGPGHTEVAARYAAQRPELVDDFSAPVLLDVEPEEPTPTPTPGPTAAPPVPPEVTQPEVRFPVLLANRRLRADRRGVVRLRLLCPATAPAECVEPVRVSAGGRTLAARSVSLAPGRAETVRVRLRPAARRRVAVRRRALRVRVRIGDASTVTATLERRRPAR